VSGKALALILVLLVIGISILLAPLALRAWVDGQVTDQIHTGLEEVPSKPVAIVFGAGYWPSGRLSHALADRMEAAIALYQAGKVNKLLLSGDNRFVDYNEPAVMAQYAEERGVPGEDLVLDYAGRRTYDSCYRARHIFGVEQAVLITQAFHLPRALYTCQQLGVGSVGFQADQRQYVRAPWYQLRELFALSRAWLDLHLFKPLPVLGDPIPVDWNQRTGAGPL
jgi:SanA protein